MKKTAIGVLSLLGGTVGGIIGTKRIMQKKLNVATDYSDKHLSLFLMMNQWVKVKQEGKNLASYFERNGFTRIAVYGMSYVGETLIEELKDTGVEVVYGIDKHADRIFSTVDVIFVDDSFGEVDAVIVTAITFFDEIKDILSEKVDCPVISLEDVLYEV